MSRSHEKRLHDLVLAQGDFVTRTLRNLGVWGADLDDCAQEVFVVVARRLPEIEPGKERGFLFACAQNKAAHFRRGLARKREVSDEVLAERAHPVAAPDLLTEQKRYRELLDQILGAMDEPVRSVFILYSFEEMTMAEVAALLEIPQGTVASRLRHARQIFKQEILSWQARERQESA